MGGNEISISHSVFSDLTQRGKRCLFTQPGEAGSLAPYLTVLDRGESGTLLFCCCLFLFFPVLCSWRLMFGAKHFLFRYSRLFLRHLLVIYLVCSYSCLWVASFSRTCFGICVAQEKLGKLLPYHS